jgi:aldose 1-epimerase
VNKDSNPSVRSFGRMPDGRDVFLHTLSNSHGMQAVITNYGGALVELKIPGPGGEVTDVVLGYDDLSSYLDHSFFFGGLIGRYCNRVANGAFILNGVEYHLEKNNGPNTLHSGTRGFDRVLWDARRDSAEGAEGLELTYLSADGEEGFPGNLRATVRYSVTPDNELRLDYKATTDKDTIVSLTSHSYFNLAGAGEGDIVAHELEINADYFTPIDATSIPTGEVRRVTGTPFDFKSPIAIGARVDFDDEQLKLTSGYDHNFVLNQEGGGSLAMAARVREPKSGRVMEVLTTEPGLQLYTGNYLENGIPGKGGKLYGPRFGFCLETQHFPDSPNKPQFPSVVLKAGRQLRSTTVYRFSTDL